MPRWSRIATAVGGLAAAGVAAVLVGRRAFAAAGDELVAKVEDEARVGEPPAVRVPAADDPALPPPVRRYFAWAIPSGQRPVRRVTFRETGDFALRPGAWTPFDAARAGVRARRRALASCRPRAAAAAATTTRRRHARAAPASDARTSPPRR